MKTSTFLTNVCAALVLMTATAVQAVSHGKGMGMAGDCPSGMGPGAGMGPGMMGGGMGMGGMGMMGGPGMMMGGMHGLYALDLTDDQRTKILQIQSDAWKNNATLMRNAQTEHAKLHGMFAADTRDPKAIGDQMQKVFELRRQMVMSSIETQNRIEALLTPEQKTQLRQYSKGGGMMMSQ